MRLAYTLLRNVSSEEGPGSCLFGTEESPMADFFRVQFGVVSRSDGHSAAKRSAYQACGRAMDHEPRI
jgi:hypothetical protein